MTAKTARDQRGSRAAVRPSVVIACSSPLRLDEIGCFEGLEAGDRHDRAARVSAETRPSAGSARSSVPVPGSGCWRLLIEEIIRSAEALSISSEAKAGMEKEASDWRFDKSIKAVEAHIPQGVFYKGQNPIRILYAAISKDLHGSTDEDCLERAKTIRTILVHVLERLAAERKAHDEIGDGLRKLTED